MRVRVCVSERGMTYETKKVQPSVDVFGAHEARDVFVKFALLDLNVDPDDILPQDASRPNIQVSVFLLHRSAEPWGRKHGYRPDFRVSHEPIGKSDRKPMSRKRAIRMVLQAFRPRERHPNHRKGLAERGSRIWGRVGEGINLRRLTVDSLVV
jgi:hypothetical protein